jgi:nicotinamide mononucleotide adenylyltransferase
VKSSDWIDQSLWEIQQSSWSRTICVLDAHQKKLDQVYSKGKVKVKLVAGEDLLKSMRKPGVWIPEQRDRLLRDYGVVCMIREGENEDYAWWNENYPNCVVWVRPKTPIRNDISSTKVRELIKRGLSAKYIIPDPVLEYVNQHKLFSKL